MSLNRTRDFLVAFSLFMAAIGTGFLIGTNYQKKFDLEQCKLAGWAFVDYMMENVPKDHPTRDSLYQHLQSRAATKCIVRFE